MTRIPIYFEDDVHLQRELPVTLEALRLHEHGLKVMTFHPVLVALNCANLDAYSDLKRDLGDRGIPLTEASPGDFAPHVQHETPGMGSLFEAVVAWLASRPTGGRETLRTLAQPPV